MKVISLYIKDMNEKFWSLFRRKETKWFLAIFWMIIFSTASMTTLNKEPAYVTVFFYFVFWVFLLLTLGVVAFSEEDDNNNAS